MLADAGDSMHELFYEGDIAEMLIADLEKLGKPPPLHRHCPIFLMSSPDPSAGLNFDFGFGLSNQLFDIKCIKNETKSSKIFFL